MTTLLANPGDLLYFHKPHYFHFYQDFCAFARGEVTYHVFNTLKISLEKHRNNSFSNNNGFSDNGYVFVLQSWSYEQFIKLFLPPKKDFEEQYTRFLKEQERSPDFSTKHTVIQGLLESCNELAYCTLEQEDFKHNSQRNWGILLPGKGKRISLIDKKGT